MPPGTASGTRKEPPLALLGLLVYAVGQFAAEPLPQRFWTAQTMSSDVPWYFIGETFVEGLCAVVSLALVAVLWAFADRRLGRMKAWWALWPVPFLVLPVGKLLNVFWHTDGIWSKSTATSDWRSFDEYLSSDTLAASLSLGSTLIAVLAVLWQARRGRGSAPAGG